MMNSIIYFFSCLLLALIVHLMFDFKFENAFIGLLIGLTWIRLELALLAADKHLEVCRLELETELEYSRNRLIKLVKQLREILS